MNKTKQIIIVVAVFVIAIASLGTIIGLIVDAGQMSDYSDGFGYTLNGSRATITDYNGSDTAVVIPDKIRGNRVVAIASGAFADKAKEITSIVINSTYSGFEIEEKAFEKLTALTKVVLPSGLKEIPDECFSGCTALKEVYMPSTLTAIGDKAFYECTSLVFSYSSQSYGEDVSESVFYLPESLLEIGNSAFYGCTRLEGLYIAKSLEKIDDNAFYNCTRLSNVTVADDSELTTIGASAFYSAIIKSSEAAPLNFPNLITIGGKAFANVKSNFTYFSFPASVTAVGENAFYNCTSLSKVKFADDAKDIEFGAGCFEDCTTLSTIKLPEAVTAIPERMFKGCSRLLYVSPFTISKNVETIGEGAFAIYSNSTSYAKCDIIVDAENENYTTIALEGFRKSGNTATPYTHGLLTNADGSVVLAYFGQNYDENSTNGNGGQTFRFYGNDGTQIKTIKSISAYAFAGVDFAYILLPMSLDNIGDYVFFNSDIDVVYAPSISWKWQEYSFAVEDEGAPAIAVSILKSAGTTQEINEFLLLLADAVSESSIAGVDLIP